MDGGQPVTSHINPLSGTIRSGLLTVLHEIQNRTDDAITDILWSIAKGVEAPVSAESHLCRAVESLLKLYPEYATTDQELQDTLDFAKEYMRLLGKTNGQA